MVVIISFCFWDLSINAQINSWAHADLSGNDVEVAVSVFGSLGQKMGKYGLDYGLFKNKTQNAYPVAHPFCATSLWMGGFDSGKNLRLSVGTFYTTTKTRFQAGLLALDGSELPGSIDVFNRVWKVSRIEIENLKKDWTDNQVIESKISNDIKYWPGRGNPFFASDLNFVLPDQELAPFFDRNNDGKYNVYDGDLPEAIQTSQGIVFEELCWSAFHDNPFSSNPIGQAIKAQVYASTFTTLCEDEPYINKTVFQDFTITNRSLKSIDSFYVGMWSNPTMSESSLGLTTHTGTNIDQSSQFTYTNNPFAFGTYAFSEALTILNQKLSSSIISAEFADNNSAWCYYRNLTGTWCDGSTIKPIGNGYSASSTLPSTKYIFYDPPRQAGGFSMLQNNIFLENIGMIGASGNITFKPGDTYNISYAFSFHQDADATAADAHLKHVDKMYDEVPKIRNYYNSNFESCNPPTYCSGAECVWPGDMDKNLQVDYRDLVYLSVGNGSSGAKRNNMTPWNWYPQSADNWSLSSPNSNVNFKNLDANGDGKLAWKDEELVILANKNKTSSGGPLNKPNLSFGQGISLDRKYVGLAKDTILKGGSTALVNINIGSNIDIPDLAGIAFNISYDSWVFNDDYTSYLMFKNFQSDTSALNTYKFTDIYETERRVNFESVWVRNDSQDKDPKGMMSRLLLRLRFEALGNTGVDTTWIEISGIRAVKTNGEIVSIGAKSIPILYKSKFSVSTNEPNISGNILVYPNPLTSDRLNIETTETIEAYRITDMLGREIINKQLAIGSNSIELNIMPGVYGLGLLTQNGWINQMLIKQ